MEKLASVNCKYNQDAVTVSKTNLGPLEFCLIEYDIYVNILYVQHNLLFFLKMLLGLLLHCKKWLILQSFTGNRFTNNVL